MGSVDNDYSNERLEFLGDAVLDAVTAEYLFLKFPDNDEGSLTKLKSKRNSLDIFDDLRRSGNHDGYALA